MHHLQERLVKIDELAAALGWKVDWIKRNWLRLHKKKGMPRKVPDSWSWPRRALEQWIEGHQQEPEITGAEPAVGLAAIVANENSRLGARYGGGRL